MDEKGMGRRSGLIIFLCRNTAVKGRLTNGEKLTRQCRKLLWVMAAFTDA